MKRAWCVGGLTDSTPGLTLGTHPYTIEEVSNCGAGGTALGNGSGSMVGSMVGPPSTVSGFSSPRSVALLALLILLTGSVYAALRRRASEG